MQVFYSLIPCLKTYRRTFYTLFTGPVRVPFQLLGDHIVLQPFRRTELIVHIAISVLPGNQVGEGGAKSHRGLNSIACYFFSMGRPEYHYMT